MTMAKHTISTSIRTALTRDLTDVEAKLVAGLGTSVSITSITEALKYLGVVHYPGWVPVAIAIAAYFLGGYLKSSTISTVEPTDSPAVAAAEVAASTVGADVAAGKLSAIPEDALKATFALLPASPADTAAPAPAATETATPTATPAV